MKLNWISTAVLAAAISTPSHANSNSDFGIGVAYDLGIGVTAQYRGTSFFVSDDALAVDVRMHNFRNGRGSLQAYIDAGGFYEDAGTNNNGVDNDVVGLRVPVGLTFGLAPNLEGYIQAVPNLAFSDNENKDGFGVDGAAGLRLRF